MQSPILRRRILLEILENNRIFSQEQLQELLLERGIETTQATLSRDFKALQVVKTPRDGYRLQRHPPTVPPSPSEVVSIEFSGQSGVVKTQPGFAPAVAIRIDHCPCPAIMGTLAGDDTILLILRQGFGPQQVLDNLEKAIPEIKQYLI